MRKSIVTIINVFALGALLAQYAIPEETDWEQKWKDVCTFDRNCVNIKNGDGTWKEPKKEVLEAFKVLAPKIHEAASLYGIDPRAIAGAVLAENSLNMTLTDNLEDFLVKYKIAPTGSLLGRKFTFGWGQLHDDAAVRVEALAAKTEHRQQRSPEEVAQALLVPEQAMKYVAAVMKDSQDSYAKYGIDISKDPAFLATVYNIGKADELAAKTKAEKRSPKYNYLGLYVARYLDKIEIAIGHPSDPKVSVETAPAPEGMVKKIKVTKAMNYSVAPLQCSSEGSGRSGEYRQYDTKMSYPAIGSFNSDDTVEEVSPGLGCDMEPWILLKNSKGNVGWVSEKGYKQSTSEVVLPKTQENNCKGLSDECKTKLGSIAGDKALTSDSKDGENILLVGTKKKVNWKKRNTDCSNSQGANVAKSKTLSKDQAKQLLDRINDKEKELRKFQQKNDQYGSNDDDTNPYKLVINRIDNNKYGLEKCAGVNVESSEGPYQCEAHFDEAMKFLNFVPKEQPGFKDILTLVNQASVMNINYNQSVNPADLDQGDLKKRIKDLRTKFKVCDKIIKALPTAKDSYAKIQKNLKDLPREMLRCQHSDLNNLIQACETFKNVFEPRPSDPSNNSVSQTSGTCSLSYYYDYSGGSYGISETQLSYDVMRALFRKTEDKDDYFHNVLEHSRCLLDPKSYTSSYSSSSSNLDDDDCSYDPFKTADFIENIVNTGCVERVFVPDMWLVKKLEGIKGKLLYRPFVEEDRFFIEFPSIPCADGGSK